MVPHAGPRPPTVEEPFVTSSPGPAPEPSSTEEPLRSADEQPTGWGDDRDARSGQDSDSYDPGSYDPDLERLLADRPPHHDRW